MPPPPPAPHTPSTIVLAPLRPSLSFVGLHPHVPTILLCPNRSGVGLDSPFSETEMETLHPLPGTRSSTGMRFFTDLDGQMNDEEALAAAEESAALGGAAGRPLRGAAAASKKKSAKAKADAAAAAGAEGEGADAAGTAAEAAAAEAPAAAAPPAPAAAAVESFAGELPTGYHTPVEDPMQIKLEWVLINNGKKHFQALGRMGRQIDPHTMANGIALAMLRRSLTWCMLTMDRNPKPLAPQEHALPCVLWAMHRVSILCRHYMGRQHAVDVLCQQDEGP